MAKSQHATLLDEFQSALKTLLKRREFRVRSRTFNRVTVDGLTQVINLQMGAADPPGTTYLRGIRESLHGWFTVNLGVYIPEVARLYGGGEVPGFVREYHCCIRARLGKLGLEGRDLWWRISLEPGLMAEIESRILGDGLPFLEAHNSRDAVLAMCRRNELNFGDTSSSRIVAAIILASRGEHGEARRLLARQAEDRVSPAHVAYVRSLAERLGVGTLE